MLEEFTAMLTQVKLANMKKVNSREESKYYVFDSTGYKNALPAATNIITNPMAEVINITTEAQPLHAEERAHKNATRPHLGG